MADDPRERSADALRDVLDAIERGEVEATPTEHAYIAGALHGFSAAEEPQE